MRTATVIVVCIGTWLPLPSYSQNTGRFSEQTRVGLEHVEKGHYKQAINTLEEIWEQDSTDAAVAENLGVAYLYGDKDAPSALKYMQAAIERGGRASFLMQHAHE